MTYSVEWLTRMRKFYQSNPNWFSIIVSVRNEMQTAGSSNRFAIENNALTVRTYLLHRKQNIKEDILLVQVLTLDS